MPPAIGVNSSAATTTSRTGRRTRSRTTSSTGRRTRSRTRSRTRARPRARPTRSPLPPPRLETPRRCLVRCPWSIRCAKLSGGQFRCCSTSLCTRRRAPPRSRWCDRARARSARITRASGARADEGVALAPPWTRACAGSRRSRSQRRGGVRRRRARARSRRRCTLRTESRDRPASSRATWRTCRWRIAPSRSPCFRSRSWAPITARSSRRHTGYVEETSVAVFPLLILAEKRVQSLLFRERKRALAVFTLRLFRGRGRIIHARQIEQTSTSPFTGERSQREPAGWTKSRYLSPRVVLAFGSSREIEADLTPNPPNPIASLAPRA